MHTAPADTALSPSDLLSTAAEIPSKSAPIALKIASVHYFCDKLRRQDFETIPLSSFSPSSLLHLSWPTKPATPFPLDLIISCRRYHHATTYTSSSDHFPPLCACAGRQLVGHRAAARITTILREEPARQLVQATSITRSGDASRRLALSTKLEWGEVSYRE
jgi:hypothetical protein